MDVSSWLNAIPLWLVFILSVVTSLAAVEGGATFARKTLRGKGEREPEAPLGSLVGGLSALLAFILGFTFSMTGNRFDTRKELVLEQANAIGTTYLRAALLPDPHSSEVRRMLRDYVDLLTHISFKTAESTLARTEDLEQQLWDQTRQIAGLDMDSEIRSLFISSLNELIDLQQSRRTVVLERRIPGMVWTTMFLLTVLSMLAIGYQVGMSGARRLRGTPMLALAFGLVILMIADMDRPGEGVLDVSQQPLFDVRESMQRSIP